MGKGSKKKKKRQASLPESHTYSSSLGSNKMVDRVAEVMQKFLKRKIPFAVFLSLFFFPQQGESKFCYVCQSGDLSSFNQNCPSTAITAPYLVHTEACYDHCFLRTSIHHPNVVYRGCMNLFPELPVSLAASRCHQYYDNIWCLCSDNLCNRGSVDDFQNPPTEEEEEEQKPWASSGAPSRKPNVRANKVHSQWMLEQPQEAKTVFNEVEAYSDMHITKSTSRDLEPAIIIPKHETNNSVVNYTSFSGTDLLRTSSWTTVFILCLALK